MLPQGITAEKQRERDRQRLEFIRLKVPRVDVIYECEINAMLSKDKEMREKFDEYLDEGRMDLRDAFAGGRTQTFKLYHKLKDDEGLQYLDVTSL
jgi:hypothetical protein